MKEGIRLLLSQFDTVMPSMVSAQPEPPERIQPSLDDVGEDATVVGKWWEVQELPPVAENGEAHAMTTQKSRHNLEPPAEPNEQCSPHLTRVLTRRTQRSPPALQVNLRNLAAKGRAVSFPLPSRWGVVFTPPSSEGADSDMRI